MKNYFKQNGAVQRAAAVKASAVIAIIALVAVIGFSMTACGGDGDGGGGGDGDGYMGSTLTITDGKVYKQAYNGVNGFEYIPYNGTIPGLNYVRATNYSTLESGSFPLSSVFNGANSITLADGKLKISLGTPKPAFTSNLTFLYLSAIPGITVSPQDAKLFSLSAISDSSEQNENRNELSLYGFEGSNKISYMYADKNVSVNGTFTQKTDGSSITSHYSMNLKAGWNTVVTSSAETNNSRETWLKTEKPSADDNKWLLIGRAANGEDD
jgi:hypothetical protein